MTSGLIQKAQLDMITFNPEGKIVFCQDLHSPKEEKLSRIFHWLMGFLWGR